MSRSRPAASIKEWSNEPVKTTAIAPLHTFSNVSSISNTWHDFNLNTGSNSSLTALRPLVSANLNAPMYNGTQSNDVSNTMAIVPLRMPSNVANVSNILPEIYLNIKSTDATSSMVLRPLVLASINAPPHIEKWSDSIPNIEVIVLLCAFSTEVSILNAKPKIYSNVDINGTSNSTALRHLVSAGTNTPTHNKN